MACRTHTIVLLCFLTVFGVVRSMPRKKRDQNDVVDKVRCEDTSTMCDKYRFPAYLCHEIKYGENHCRKFCGFCDPPEYEVPDVEKEEPPKTCNVQYSSRNVSYVSGQEFTIGCASCTCDGPGWGCVDIHCMDFQLPDPACFWEPPMNDDKCCPSPYCPNGIHINYPPFWVDL